MLFVRRWKIFEILLAAFLVAAPGCLPERVALALDQQSGAGVRGSDRQDSARLEFRLVDVSMTAEQALQGRPPLDSEILYGRQRPNEPKVPYLVRKGVLLSEADIVDAQPGFDQRTREPIVSFRFSRNGARKFALITQENVGRPFAIILDNEVISAPVIREPITGGSGQISGSFTVKEAANLADFLRFVAPPTIPNSR
jgi:preprotein translocase subunit SecD